MKDFKELIGIIVAIAILCLIWKLTFGTACMDISANGAKQTYCLGFNL